jgi:toxin ParE1/3/4
MPFEVFLTDDASRDLEALYEYIASHDATEKAEYVLDETEKVFLNLAEHPARGAYPKELLAIGLRDYREIFFKPYRLIYRVISKKVYVMVVADGGRDMQTLLQRRLFQP